MKQLSEIYEGQVVRKLYHLPGNLSTKDWEQLKESASPMAHAPSVGDLGALAIGV